MIRRPPRSTLFPYTDALPISQRAPEVPGLELYGICKPARVVRSEEHTSELQSHSDLVCRLLLEKKKTPSCTPSSTATTWSSCSPRSQASACSSAPCAPDACTD